MSTNAAALPGAAPMTLETPLQAAAAPCRKLVIKFALHGRPIVPPDPFAAGINGVETATLQLASALAADGHDVTVFCPTPTDWRWSGVALARPNHFLDQPAAREGDLLIIERMPSLARMPHAFRAVFFHAHATLPLDDANEVRLARGGLDRILTVSAWQAQQWREIAPDLPPELFLVGRNGVDLDLVREVMSSEPRPPRDPKAIVYTTQPERGLDVLLDQVLPLILAEEPGATLHLAGYETPDALDRLTYLQRVNQLMDSFGPRVVWHGSLGKRELYRLFAGCGLYVYPTPGPFEPEFRETSCITAMEAMACGVPWLSTDAGALPETVGAAGVIVPLNGAEHAGLGDVPGRLAAEALAIMRNPGRAELMRQEGLSRARQFGWAPVAAQVVAAAEEIAAEKASKPAAPRRPLHQIAQGVMVCTPSHSGNVTLGFAAGLAGTINLLPMHGINCAWRYEEGMMVDMARARLTQTFLDEPGFSHLFWADADVTWSGEDVLRLIGHDLDVVGGTYAMRQSTGKRQEFLPVSPQNYDPETLLIEANCIGAGCLLIKRQVFHRLMAAYPNHWWRSFDTDNPGGKVWRFFSIETDEDGSRWAGDYNFCRMWRAIGGRIFVDLSLRLTHTLPTHHAPNPLSFISPLGMPAPAPAPIVDLAASASPGGPGVGQ